MFYGHIRPSASQEDAVVQQVHIRAGGRHEDVGGVFHVHVRALGRHEDVGRVFHVMYMLLGNKNVRCIAHIYNSRTWCWWP